MYKNTPPPLNRKGSSANSLKNVEYNKRLIRTVSSANHLPALDNGLIVDRPELVPRPINRVVSSANHISANSDPKYVNLVDRPELYNIKYITGKNGNTKGGRRTRARKHKNYHRRRTCKK